MNEKRRKGILGLRVLAVLSLTAITLFLTVLMVFGLIETFTFVVIFAVWYALTALLMFGTGGMRITDEEDAERKGEPEEDPYAEYRRDGREL